MLGAAQAALLGMQRGGGAEFPADWYDKYPCSVNGTSQKGLLPTFGIVAPAAISGGKAYINNTTNTNGGRLTGFRPPHVLANDTPTSFTMCLKFSQEVLGYTPTNTPIWRQNVQTGTGGCMALWTHGYNGTTHGLYAAFTNGTTDIGHTISAANAYQVGVEYPVVVTYDHSSRVTRLFVNGALVDEKTLSAALLTTWVASYPAGMGTASPSHTVWSNRIKVRDLHFFTRALSIAEACAFNLNS